MVSQDQFFGFFSPPASVLGKMDNQPCSLPLCQSATELMSAQVISSVWLLTALRFKPGLLTMLLFGCSNTKQVFVFTVRAPRLLCMYAQALLCFAVLVSVHMWLRDGLRTEPNASFGSPSPLRTSPTSYRSGCRRLIAQGGSTSYYSTFSQRLLMQS
jgi:hypothetical protein